jgi:hypothetical protein
MFDSSTIKGLDSKIYTKIQFFASVKISFLVFNAPKINGGFLRIAVLFLYSHILEGKKWSVKTARPFCHFQN